MQKMIDFLNEKKGCFKKNFNDVMRKLTPITRFKIILYILLFYLMGTLTVLVRAISGMMDDIEETRRIRVTPFLEKPSQMPQDTAFMNHQHP